MKKTREEKEENEYEGDQQQHQGGETFPIRYQNIIKS